MRGGKHVRELWDRKLPGRLAANLQFYRDQDRGTKLAYTKTSLDTKEGAVFPAPFRFEITCIILIAEDALVAWWMVCEFISVLDTCMLANLARKRAMAVP